MWRGKPRKRKGLATSVNNNNNRLEKGQYEAEKVGKQKTENSENVKEERGMNSSGGSDGSVKESYDSKTTIPPICQEFLAVVSGMGLQIIPEKELKSKKPANVKKNLAEQHCKHSNNAQSKLNKEQKIDTQIEIFCRNSNVMEQMPINKRELRLGEGKSFENKSEEIGTRKSVNSESIDCTRHGMRSDKPTQYKYLEEFLGGNFLKPKVVDTNQNNLKQVNHFPKYDKDEKDDYELKGSEKAQLNVKKEGNPTWKYNNKSIDGLNNKGRCMKTQHNWSRLPEDSKPQGNKKQKKKKNNTSKNSFGLVSHDASWNTDNYKSDYESTLRWDFKRKFLEKNKNRFPESELVALAQVFANTVFLGCKYPKETMDLVSELGSDLATEYQELKDLKHVANLPPDISPDMSVESSFHCTDIRYRHPKDCKVSQSSIKEINVAQKRIKHEMEICAIEEMEPQIVDATYDILSSSRPNCMMGSKELHKEVLTAIGQEQYFTRPLFHDILLKHPTLFNGVPPKIEPGKNPNISTMGLLKSKKIISDDCETDQRLYTDFNSSKFVNYENSFDYEDDDMVVLSDTKGSVLTLDENVDEDLDKADVSKNTPGTIVTLTESDADDALKEKDFSLDWVDLVEESDKDYLNQFNQKVLSIVNQLKHNKPNFKVLASEMKQVPINGSEDELNRCVILVYDMAMEDRDLTASCADLCKSLEMVKAPKEGKLGEFVNFRRLLLLKVQCEFEKSYEDANMKPVRMVKPAKGSFLGIVKFIGELYRVNMLTTRIVHECLKKMIVASDDTLLEGGCCLLAIVGNKFKTETRKLTSGRNSGINNMNIYLKELEAIFLSKKVESSLSNLLENILISEGRLHPNHTLGHLC